MGLLNDLVTEGLSLLGVNVNPGVPAPAPFGKDFPHGMVITEVVDGPKGQPTP